MALSAFDDRSRPPQPEELAAVLGGAVAAWNELQRRIAARYDPLVREWGFTSKTTGWGMRLKYKERVILYMTPCRGHFLASFVLGEKAVAAAHAGGLPDSLLGVIDSSKKYTEGRGVRFEVRSPREVPPLEALASIKMTH